MKVPIYNERSREYLERALENFCKFVTERYGKNIILIKADLKDRYISLDNTLEMFSDSDNTFKTKKAFINGFEEEFARLTDCHVIDISKRFYAALHLAVRISSIMKMSSTVNAVSI